MMTTAEHVLAPGFSAPRARSAVVRSRRMGRVWPLWLRLLCRVLFVAMIVLYPWSTVG